MIQIWHSHEQCLEMSHRQFLMSFVKPLQFSYPSTVLTFEANQFYFLKLFFFKKMKALSLIIALLWGINVVHGMSSIRPIVCCTRGDS